MGGLQNWMGPATGQRAAPASGRQSARRTDSTLRWRRAGRGIGLVELARWRCYCNHAVDRRCELRAATRVEAFAGGGRHRAVPQEAATLGPASERLLPACQACQPHPSDTSSHEHAAADTGPTPSAATKLEAALPTCDGQLLCCKRHHAAGSSRSQALPGPAGSPARAADPLCSESLHHGV